MIQNLCAKLKCANVIAIILLVVFVMACFSCNLIEQNVDGPINDGDSFDATDDSDLTSEMQTEARPDIDGLIYQQSPSPLCPDPEQTRFLTNYDVYETPLLPEPEPRHPFRDPIFMTCIVRVTDRNSDLSPGDSSVGLKNEYSRVQSFNADGSLILVRGIEATWYLYDAFTLHPLIEIPISVEPRWDATNPYLLYYTEDTRLLTHNVRTGEIVLVHDFSADFPDHSLAAVWTRYEGSPSLDIRYWGFLAQDANWDAVALLVYDQSDDKVIAKLELHSSTDIDSVTISPLGDYFLAFFDYCESGLGNEEHPCGLMVYDQNLQNPRGLLRIIGHSDLALDIEGREVLIFQDIDTDHIAMLDLESGIVTPLGAIDFSHTPIGLHFSGRAYQRPGWALVSTYDGDPNSYTWMDDQVFALELKPHGQVVRLAHTHSLVDDSQEHDYWAEPHASVNQDFTRVVFTSNWGHSGTAQVEMYMIELPVEWMAGLP